MKTKVKLLVVKLASLIDCIEKSHERNSKYGEIIIPEQNKKDLKAMYNDLYKMKTDNKLNRTQIVAMRLPLNTIIKRLVSDNEDLNFKCELLNMHISDLINDLVAQIVDIRISGEYARL